MNADTLSALADWYSSNCNGDWEHQYGIRIDTLDNPGWSVRIDLSGTALESKLFERVETERSSGDWLHCRVEKFTFMAWGGPSNLEEMLRRFLDWSIQQ